MRKLGLIAGLALVAIACATGADMVGADEYLPPIPADVDIVPDTLNLSSKGKWITCFIQLPEGYDVADISSCSILFDVECHPD